MCSREGTKKAENIRHKEKKEYTRKTVIGERREVRRQKIRKGMEKEGTWRILT